MKSLFFPRIHYEFNFYSANPLSIRFFFANSVWIHFLLRVFTIHLANMSWIQYLFRTSLWIQFFFRQFTTNLLYIVYNWPNSTKWPFLDNIGPFLNSGDFLWHYLTSNNLEFKFSTKFWVKTYVYLIYFDQPARFDPYWTGLTRARGTDFVRLRPASAF